MALTADQSAELTPAAVDRIVNAQANDGQTVAQARAWAIEGFRQACNWEGVGFPSPEDVETEVARWLARH